MILEICVDDVAGLEAAVRGGADRIGRCGELSRRGGTPYEGGDDGGGRPAVVRGVTI